jgi:hypothetical protein
LAAYFLPYETQGKKLEDEISNKKDDINEEEIRSPLVVDHHE